MFRSEEAYRSPFNGPRSGVVLAMLVILVGQMLSTFHAPEPAGLHSTSHACCTGEASAETPAETPAEAVGTAHPVTKHADHEGDCSGGECDTGCGQCCHHVPMTSPLPSPHTITAAASIALVLQPLSVFHSSDRTPPFHPPRS